MIPQEAAYDAREEHEPFQIQSSLRSAYSCSGDQTFRNKRHIRAKACQSSRADIQPASSALDVIRQKR